MSGTPYADVPAFGRAHADEGLVVYLEACEQGAYDIARHLHGLRHAGWFEHASGVLIGRTPAPDSEKMTQHEAVADALGMLDVPVVLDADIGHTQPFLPLVNGASARVTVTDGVGVVTQHLGGLPLATVLAGSTGDRRPRTHGPPSRAVLDQPAGPRAAHQQAEPRGRDAERRRAALAGGQGPRRLRAGHDVRDVRLPARARHGTASSASATTGTWPDSRSWPTSFAPRAPSPRCSCTTVGSGPTLTSPASARSRRGTTRPRTSVRSPPPRSGPRRRFVSAAARAERAASTGWRCTAPTATWSRQFLDGRHNHRADGYGGSADDRSRFLREILEGIRQSTGRASSSGCGSRPSSSGSTSTRRRRWPAALMAGGHLDYLDLSLWDVRKQPHGTDDDGLLLDHFEALPRHGVRWATRARSSRPPTWPGASSTARTS